MLKHYNIPIFIPEMACPHQCIFCDQRKISGQQDIPTIAEVKQKIENYLATIPLKNSHIEIGFFGGSFTGIPMKQQKEYLQAAAYYVINDRVKSIRISTRPDYIDKDILNLLKENHVETIELGAQSLDEEVLLRSGRGHGVNDIENAAELIKTKGFKLGLQMMIGLPYDTKEKALYTAKRIVELGADNTRIYPTLVIKGTVLEQQFVKNTYAPLSLVEAVQWSRDIYQYFEKHDVKVIRIGLHPSKELNSEHSLIAGPYHPSFKELVLTEIWKKHLFENINFKSNKSIIIYVPDKQINYAIGHQATNKNMLKNHFNSVVIKTDTKLNKRTFYVDYY